MRRCQAGEGGIWVCLGYAAEPVCRGKATVPPLPALRAEPLSPQWPEALVCGGETVTVDLSMCVARAPASLRPLSGLHGRLLISLAGPASLTGERIMTALCPEPAPRDTGCGCIDLLARAPLAGSPRRFAGWDVCACMCVHAHVRIHVHACVHVYGHVASVLFRVQCLHTVGAQFKGAVGITSSHFLNKIHPSAWNTEGEEGPLPVAQGPGPQLVGVAGPALLFLQGCSSGEFRHCLPRLRGSEFPFPSEPRPPQRTHGVWQLLVAVATHR